MGTEQPRPSDPAVLVCGACANRWGADAWGNHCPHATRLLAELEEARTQISQTKAALEIETEVAEQAGIAIDILHGSVADRDRALAAAEAQVTALRETLGRIVERGEPYIDGGWRCEGTPWKYSDGEIRKMARAALAPSAGPLEPPRGKAAP